MDEYLHAGTTVIKYTDILADLQHQVLFIYTICGIFLIIYVMFNLFVRESERFWGTESELPEQIKDFMDFAGLMFALFVCLTTGLVLLGIRI